MDHGNDLPDLLDPGQLVVLAVDVRAATASSPGRLAQSSVRRDLVVLVLISSP